MATTSSSSHALQIQAKETLSADSSRLTTLLSHLTSSDPSLQSNAQTLLNYLKKQYPNSLALRLARLLHSRPPLDTRNTVLLLLKRLLTRSECHLWRRLVSMYRTELKRMFLDCFRNEYSRTFRMSLCDLISDIAVSETFPGTEWPELIELMFRSFNSNSEIIQESVLLLFCKLSRSIGGTMVFDQVDTLRAALLRFLDSSHIWQVRIAAIKASVNLVLYLTSSFDDRWFQDLLMQMMKTLSEVVNSEYRQRHEHAQKVLEDLIVLAGKEPGFLMPQIYTVVDIMLLIVEKESCNEKTRCLGMEFVITVAEEREQGRSMILKLPHLIKRLLSDIMMMLAAIEDDRSWEIAESNDQDAGETSLCCFGMESLGRVAIALGGKTILSNYPDLFAVYLGALEWQKRHAAVTSLAIIAKGRSKALKENLEQLVKPVIKVFRDSHPRVRWAAINAIREFSKHLSPELQDQYHQQVLPALTAALDDFQNPRVQAQAASAMLFFSQNCTSDILTPYLNGMVNKLLKFLQKGKRMLKEGALTALASIASSSQEHFQDYYNTVMPYLKVILMSATDQSNPMLLATSMDCITMVWMAVGKEKFSDDTQLVVQVLTSQQSQMETDDRMRKHVLQAWGRLCKCLGQEFLPYMGVVMPRLLQSAQLKTYVTSMSTDSNAEEPDDDSIKTMTCGDERIGIKTNVLEEIVTACNVLCCCVAELKEGFYLWIDEVAHTLVPLLKFDLHEEVRTAAVSAMPLILRSAKSATEKGYLQGVHESPFKKLAANIIPALVEALHKESEKEMCARILDSLNECIQISGLFLNETQAKNFVDEITEVFTVGSFKKSEREKRGKTEDIDERERELLKEENEQEEKVYNKAGDCLGTFIKTYKASLSPFFDKILSCIALMWGNDTTAKERRIALHIFCDVAKQCREEAFRYYETSLPFLLRSCNDENPEVRQVVACGIGVCAQFGGSVFKPLAEEAISSLNAVIGHPKALHPDNVMAHDFAVSALGKICQFHHDSINAAEEVVSTWLRHLPLKNDLNEAKVVHDQLCSMVENSDRVLLGSRNVNLPKVIAVFAEVLWAGNNLATAQTVGRVINLLKKCQHKLPPATWASILSSLQPHEQNLLQSMLSS